MHHIQEDTKHFGPLDTSVVETFGPKSVPKNILCMDAIMVLGWESGESGLRKDETIPVKVPHSQIVLALTCPRQLLFGKTVGTQQVSFCTFPKTFWTHNYHDHDSLYDSLYYT